MRTSLLVGAVAVPVYAEEAPNAKLDGIEARCARDVANSTWDVMRDQSWAQISRLLSLGGAAEMVALLGDTIRAELRGCFVDVYRLGVEDGRRIDSSQETAH